MTSTANVANAEWKDNYISSGDNDAAIDGYPAPPQVQTPDATSQDDDITDGYEHGEEDGVDWYGGTQAGPSAPDGEVGVEIVDLDAVPVEREAGPGGERSGPRRFDGKAAAWFGGAVVLAVLAAFIGATLFYGSDDKPVSVGQASLADPGVPVPTARPVPPSPEATPGGNDHPLAYSADAAGSCLAGSTSAQSMTGADPHNAFVCARGGVDGQVIDIDLSKTYTITAISLTPGWIGPDASGVSQWSQHRVVTTVQYLFNDSVRTLLTQDTKNVHGEAVLPVKRVLASKVRMLIRQTSRPPADTPPTSGAPTPGLFPNLQLPTTPRSTQSDALFGEPNSDPVDATFAISNFKIIGHEPL